MYVVGLGLCTFANIASEEMSRDLANEIGKLLGSSNTYIRKKVRTLPIHIAFKTRMYFRLLYVLFASSRRFLTLRIILSRKPRIFSLIETTACYLQP